MTPPSTTRAARTARDTGRVSVFLAIAVAGIITIVGVAVDASGQLRTQMRAQNIAAEAARAAGQGIDLDHTAQTGEHLVSQARAQQYAEEYLASAFANLDQEHDDPLVVPADDGTAVEITVTIVYDTQILSLFGREEIPVTATSTAVLITG